MVCFVSQGTQRSAEGLRTNVWWPSGHATEDVGGLIIDSSFEVLSEHDEAKTASCSAQTASQNLQLTGSPLHCSKTSLDVDQAKRPYFYTV